MDRAPQTIFEGHGGLPSQLILGLRCIDRVSMVVTWTVRNKADETIMWPARGMQLIEQRADAAHHVEVGALAAAPDVVRVANAASSSTSSNARTWSSTKSQSRTLSPRP